MASPSEEIRSAQEQRERDMRPPCEQASAAAAYTPGEPDALYGWDRFPPSGKSVPYPSAGGPDSKRSR